MTGETLRTMVLDKDAELRRGAVLAMAMKDDKTHLPDLIEAFYDGKDDMVRIFVAMSDTAEQSGKIATDAAYTLAIASRYEIERRLGHRARVTFLIGRRGGSQTLDAGLHADRAGRPPLDGARAA
jgi:hypothetical protein